MVHALNHAETDPTGILPLTLARNVTLPAPPALLETLTRAEAVLKDSFFLHHLASLDASTENICKTVSVWPVTKAAHSARDLNNAINVLQDTC